MMNISRRKAKVVRVGNVRIGGDSPVAVQSMVKTKTSNAEKAVRQILSLQNCGCEIVRLAVRDKDDALALKKIKQKVRIPMVADIHFDWRLALAAVESGVDKIRLNPGNIYKREQIREVVSACKMHRIPIRVGLNSGSLPGRNATSKRHKDTTIAGRMVTSALDYIKILERFGFYDTVVSLKASNIADTIQAYRLMARACDYPFHLGLTATGLPLQGTIKSSIAIGALLLDGIGDTIRISLTGKPEQEVKAAQSILDAVGVRHFGPEIISCPTCGRCEVDLVKIVKELETRLSSFSLCPSAKSLKVAVMGCVVNGPGEAKEADIGIAFGKKDALLFKKARLFKKVSSDECVNVLLKEMRSLNV